MKSKASKFKSASKLAVKRETLRTLGTDLLADVAGGKRIPIPSTRACTRF